MPAYNVEKYIDKSISCILNQSYGDLELLIADDASTDRTKEVINQFSDPRIKCFHNTINLGYLETWNKLMKEALGEFITFQDSDDLCDLNRIEFLVNELSHNSELAVVGSNFQRINAFDKVVEISHFPLSHEEVFNSMPKKFHFIGSALMIRKSVYNAIGGYNTFFNRMGAEDHYWMYLIMEKFRFKNIEDALYKYRFNETSVTGNISNNPSKLNVFTILTRLIEQRIETGTDDLERGNIDQLKRELDELNRPFLDDPSYYYFYVARRRYYEGHKHLAIRHQLQAIKKAPLNFSYYRDLLYFLRK